MLNAEREIRGGEYVDLLVQFKPTSQRKSVETLDIRSPKGNVSVVLTGEGVSPTIAVEPPGGVLDAGHVLRGDMVTRSCTLRNTSVFPMAFSMLLADRSLSNYSGLPLFACAPAEATVAPGGAAEVRVSFSPDFERRAPFAGVFEVDVPNQTDVKTVTIRGRCWNCQVYVLPASPGDEPRADDPSLLEDALAPPVGLLVPPASEEEARALATPGPRMLYSWTLVFPRGAGGGAGGAAAAPAAAEKKVVVGCIELNDPKRGSPGTFEVTFPADAAGVFTADVMKGAVNAGQAATVTFKFTAPRKNAGGAGTEYGQWKQVTARIALKGGFVPPGIPEDRFVNVVLRGFVPI